MKKLVFFFLVLTWAGFVPAQDSAASRWHPLSPEIARVFEDTMIPDVETAVVRDLNSDGTPEIVILSHSPVSRLDDEAGKEGIRFQSLLTIFEKNPKRKPDSFPFGLAVKKSKTSDTPKPAGVVVEDVGGGPAPEVIWLEGGPNEKGRYSKSVVYQFESGTPSKLVERVRFENPVGWVRVYDLDKDGVSELLAFNEDQGEVFCAELVYDTGTGWSSLRQKILETGAADIQSFQREHGLDPTGRVTRTLYQTVKSALDPGNR